MSSIPLILIAIFALLILTGLILVIKVRSMRKNGQEVKPDYRALFFMGITFAGAGVALATSLDNPGMYGMTAMGIIYMVMGATHKDQWTNKNG
jgi:uncharacterized membrane protein